MRNPFNKLLLSIVSATSLASQAHDLGQPKASKDPILSPIQDLFEGMREHDKTRILNQFTQTAVLQRLTKKGEIKHTDIKQFAQSVSENPASLDEHLLAIRISQQDGLASVWSPFAFYLNGKLSHCGTNSFQLVKVNGQWKIHYLIDVTHTGDCAAFVSQYTGN